MMKIIEPVKWLKGIMILFGTFIIMAIGITILVDPYFHYHAPVGKYRLREARYTNNGIAKNFDYEAVIIGTSITGNFHITEYKDLFDKTAVKLTLPGASFRETSVQLERAFQYNENISEVLIGLDLDRITMDWEWMKDYCFPEWLYDDAFYNDMSYLLNKSILLHDCLGNMLLNFTGEESTSLDDWGKTYGETGTDAVQASFSMPDKEETNRHISQEEMDIVNETIGQNFETLVLKYPEVTFRFFIPPYNVYYWNERYIDGTARVKLEAEKIAIEKLLKHENVEIHCFYEENQFKDCNNYYDVIHFSTEYASEILQNIEEGKNRITKDNVEEHMNITIKRILQYPYEKRR